MRVNRHKVFWCITIQRTAGKGNPFTVSSWKQSKMLSRVPIMFPTSKLAEDYMAEVFSFQNVSGRNISACIERKQINKGNRSTCTEQRKSSAPA